METPSARSGHAGGRERQGVSRDSCSVICGEGEGTRTVFLVACEVMEVMHDGAAQMAEHEPEDGLEHFLGCRRHAGRVSQVGVASRIIVDDALLRFCSYQQLDSYCTFQRRCGNR